MTHTRQTRCIDCNSEGRVTAVAAVHPGPRCLEHHRARKRHVSKVNHGRRLQAVFQITTAVYEFLYRKQGGKCFVCQRATGRARRLAVDHDHQCNQGHTPDVGCPKCIRCLACGPCNKDVLGRLDADALRRAIVVLTDPPAQQWLKEYNSE